MDVVFFVVSVIIVMLYSVSTIGSVNLPLVSDMRCLSCTYNHAKRSPPPELLWANTTSVVLRARFACFRWCTIQWYTDVGTLMHKDRPYWNWVTSSHCYDKEYCVMNGTSGESLNVSTAFWSEVEKSWNRSEITIATVCPESPPYAPKETTCSLGEGVLRIRWRPQPDACRNFVQYMVRIRNESNPHGGDWQWIGEALSDGHNGRGNEAFAGDVRLCSDNVDLLCADITDYFQATQVQLGIRRTESNISDKLISKTEFIHCLANKDVATVTQNTTTTINSASLVCNKEDYTDLKSIIFLIGGALFITIVLLPLSFIAGVRYGRSRFSRGNSCSTTSRQHINNNQPEWNGMVGTQELISNEVPPAYTYDYTYRDVHLRRNRPLTPPLPEEHRTFPSIPLPPLPREQNVEVQNDLYVSEPQR